MSNDKHFSEPPVFCEQCPNLAMALVEDSPLCQKCISKMAKDRSPVWVMENARPLEIVPNLITPVLGVRGDREDDTESGIVA